MTKYRRTDVEVSRRKFVSIALGSSALFGAGALSISLAGLRTPRRVTAENAPALPGDVLVYATGDQAGQPLNASKLNGTITHAWPQGKDREGRLVVRKAEPNNLLMVFHFPESQLAAPTDLKATAAGVVAYSGICMHLGCPVGDSEARPGTLLCPCHSGAYDPKAGCQVIGGPPPRALPQLPIKLDGQRVVVTGPLEHPYFGSTLEEWQVLLEKAKRV